jgi:hypothetical protein
LDVSSPTWRPTHATDVNFDNRLRLIGYDAKTQNVGPGQTVPLTLYWQVEAPIDQDYTVFIHLVDDNGAVIAQGDGPPLQGFYPTSAWAPGEILNDTHEISLPADARQGRYQVLVGLYNPVTGKRLPVAGDFRDNQVPLATIDVGVAP